MNKRAGLLLLALAGLSLLGLIFLLRKPEPVQAPPPPPAPKAVPVTPALPPLRFPNPPAQESGDPNLNRWRSAVRLHNQRDVLELQSQFLAGEADYREPLMKMAKDEADPRIRAFTVAVLGRMKTPPSEEYFLERAGDPHEYPRKSAVEALEKIGTKACLETADKLAFGDPVEAVRTAAAQAAKAVRSRGR